MKLYSPDITKPTEVNYYWHEKVLVEPMPKPKRGEWIYGEHDVAMCDGYRCDRCGFFVPWDYEHKSIDFINDYHYCPNCGADMRNSSGKPNNSKERSE